MTGVRLYRLLNAWKLASVMAHTAQGGLPLWLRAVWPLIINRVGFVRQQVALADDGLPVRASKFKRYDDFLERLEGGPFLAGRDEPSLPDLSAYPQFALYYMMEFRGGDDILERPALMEWLRRMRPHVEGKPPLLPPHVRERDFP